jgi:hypothetical protein
MRNTLVSLVAGLLVWGSFAAAQSNFTLTNGSVANVPFNFTVGNQAFPSGTYIVQLDFEKQVVVIRNNDRKVRIFLSKNDDRREPSAKTLLVFHHLGGQFFLSAIWLQGTTAGEHLLPGNLETEMARHQTGPAQTIALQAQGSPKSAF